MGIILAAVPLVVVWLLAPRMPLPQKQLTYESGVIPFGQAWAQFNVRYYLFALVFVVFDVEVIYLYPWAIVFRQLGMFAFLEMVLFLFILLVGLAYAWRKGALEWV
ncbi:MAG TPA: NADH-quinone oxidoreductase subunit A [bacterium]|nr:NADH-quinone oxidoreductase subunit A [bacterium]